MTVCYFPCDEWPLPLTLVSPAAADPGVRHLMRAPSVNTQMKGPGLPGVIRGRSPGITLIITRHEARNYTWQEPRIRRTKGKSPDRLIKTCQSGRGAGVLVIIRGYQGQALRTSRSELKRTACSSCYHRIVFRGIKRCSVNIE